MKVCRICILKHGLKGTEIESRSFKTDEEYFEHMENVHGMRVRREGETEEACAARCAKKGIVPDRTKCQCVDCKLERGEPVASPTG